MQDKQALTFGITLTQRDWDMELGGWRCPTLKIPGAIVECVFVSGNRVDKSWYEVNYELDIVRWVHTETPEQATFLIKLTEELSTRELTLRWKKLAIILPALASIIVAVMVAMFSYLLPARSHSSANERIAGPTETCSEQVRITGPVDLQRVGISVSVEGSFQNLSADQKIWVLIYPLGIGRYYPQNPVREKLDNTWEAPVNVGVKEDSGREFYIYAILADKQAQDELNMYIKHTSNENDFPGISELPRGSQICQHIKVTRK